MSSIGSGDDGLTTSERREAAREKARALRDSHRKKDRRGRLLLQGGLIVVILAVVVIVFLVITNNIRPPSPGPKNMLSDGITIGQDLKATTTPALQPGNDPVPAATSAAGVISIQIYLDYHCPICGEFEATNATQIETWLKSGAATLEIHPIALLDNQSLGQKYSTRAANAAACVANYSPNSYFAFNSLLFDSQPKEGTPGLTDAKLISLTSKAGVSNQGSITSCVKNQEFTAWVTAATTRATTGPIRNTDVAKITGTPTVIIDGTEYTGLFNDASAFATAIAKAAGDSFSEGSSASPSPSPTPAP